MDLLHSSSSDDEDEKVSFRINKNYAKNYKTWRRKEEKQKLLDRYGDVESSGSSSEEEEIRSTPQMDKDWLRAFAVVRFNQSRLYKKGERFFHDVAEPVNMKREKATTLKDHERKFILEKGGIESDEESQAKPNLGKSYYEEQDELKKSLKEAIGESSEESEDEGSSFMVKKQKTAQEKKKEENEYLEWLTCQREELGDPEAEAELAPLREYWNDPSLTEKERILRDYILNNGYMDQETSDSEEEEKPEDIDAEEKFLEEAEEYEHKYNFRHEEPGGDEIKSYPRVIETSVRTKDTKRAEKRKNKMERKKREKDTRMEEIRLLQKLQREEKKEKLDKLRKVAHNPTLDYDLEADFDPDEHAKIMQQYFNDDYYGHDDDSSKKPRFDFDEAIDDEPGDWWQERLKEEKQLPADEVGRVEDNADYDEDVEQDEEEPGVDDPNFIMDADYDANIDYKAEKKKKKKAGKASAKRLPVFDPTTKTFDEYIDEYLKDKIDSLPFTYREVLPNDFGLTTEEILKAPEKELNCWVSVKKMSQYRTKQQEFADKRKFGVRARNEKAKFQVLPSLLQETQETNTDEKGKKKKRRKKKKANDNEDAVKGDDDLSSTIVTDTREIDEDKNDDGDDSGRVNVTNAKSKDQKFHLDGSPAKKSKRNETEQTFSAKKKISKNESSDRKQEMKPSRSKLEEKDKSQTTASPAGKKTNGEKSPKALNQATKPVADSTSEGRKRKWREESNGEPPKKKQNKLMSNDINVQKTKMKTESSEKKVKSIDLKAKDGSGEKKKKLKKMTDNSVAGDTSDNAALDSLPVSSNHLQKMRTKSKKKKVSINMFDVKKSGDSQQQTDRKQLEKQLSQVMSASRLSKFGIGPDAHRLSKSAKRKKNKMKKKKKRKLKSKTQ